MFVLDTNTLIYFFKGMGGVSKRLLATPPSEIAVPTIVLYELEVGIAKSSSPSKRRAQLDVITGPLDTLIAGTALSQGAVLVSRNVAEFERIRELRS